MGETRVDLLHLLEDLRDAYPGALEETILTEIVANSLDSGADLITFETDRIEGTFTVVDNGSGMQRRDLARYHDIASSSKARGEGIGFAGVGIKLSLLASQEVLTETRRASSHVASLWHLASRHKAPWRWLQPVPGLVKEKGTAVRLKVKNPLSPLLEDGFVEATLRRQFEPLLNPDFAALLSPLYGHPISFQVNGRTLESHSLEGSQQASHEIRLARKRKPSALVVLLRTADRLPEDRQGIAISTYGKVIKRGWDWLGITPTTPELIGGIVEAPDLAGCLTLNKGDFIRTGPRGAMYIAYRRAIQTVVGKQLAEWGDARDVAEESQRRAARPLERDLENVLVDLADDFPLLASLVEQRLGGQRKLPIGRPSSRATAEDARGLIAASVASSSSGSFSEDGKSSDIASHSPDAAASAAEGSQTPDDQSKSGSSSHAEVALPASKSVRRPARYGLAIEFSAREDDTELARLVESTVVVNEAHPAYRRAVASRSEGYHLAIAVAMALAPLAVQPAEEHEFITAFLARWGTATDHVASRKRR